ncbi:MAG: MFS transporter [Chloroflexota bacterium]
MLTKLYRNYIQPIGTFNRDALMNMSAPLYTAFCMEQTPEHQQGLVSSVLNIAWQVGWSVGPYLSGIVQEQYGFTPLFLTTTVLYVSAILLIWVFFQGSEERVVAVTA